MAHAWEAEAFTATDVMESTGLTRSTAIESTEDLIARGLLSELPNARSAGEYRMGRPARRFALRADAAVLVGVDAANEDLTVRVTDLRSHELSTRRLSYAAAHDDPAERRRMTVDAVGEAVAASGRSLADVLALCIGVAAPVNGEGLSPRHRDGFWQRMNPDLIHAFEQIPLVRIYNDASLAAVAEGSLGEAVGYRDYIALLAGTQMGAGVVTDGLLLRGAHGGVGEMVAFDHVEGVGNADGLGRRIAAWAADLVSAGDLSDGGALTELSPAALDASTVLRLAAAGDADARRVVDRAAATLARIVSVLGSMFDPQRVIVSGAMAAEFSDIVAAARSALPTDLDLPAPELVTSHLGADVVVIGAVAAASALARDHALDIIG